MSARDTIALALSGFDTRCKTTGSAESIVGMTLEKARNEARCLLNTLDGSSSEALTAGALEGRLEALDRFLDEYVTLSWKEPAVAAETEGDHG
ncbi:MAG TPA: hypothetical protein VFR23_26105 [Jiangellaceae bacterium]|nr:hypothetical protein [Jiangellaceae bacterium]